MDRRDRLIAREAARLVVMWLCGLTALGCLLLLALVLAQLDRQMLVYAFQHGSFLTIGVVLAVSVGTWLLLLFVGPRDQGGEAAEESW
ncbi:MAG: hypothetical protein WCD21_02430 [Streptomyces sp.]